MKTVSRLVRRCIAAAFGIVLLILTVNAALLGGLIVHYGLKKQQNGTYFLREFADSFTLDESGQPVPGDPRPVEEQLTGCAWSMLLDGGGEVVWRYRLPENLDHPYTAGQIAAFSRWYLDDYPVFVYRCGEGLLVTGMPRGSLTRFNFYMDHDLMEAMVTGFLPLLALDALLVLAVCMLLGWRASRGLRAVAGGIDALAEGEGVRLREAGMAAELAEKLNRTSDRLQRQSALIARRDTARTNWIAGVSHDIRTPLSLILGYAEQLEHDDALPCAQQKKAAAIRSQCETIRALIEDLNLTSKLQYDAQPLRLSDVQVGPLLRRIVTNFLNGDQAGLCTACLELSPAAGQAVLRADGALLARAFMNLLLNSARHNPGGCRIAVRGALSAAGVLTLTFTDDGAGYPPAVLLALSRPDAQPPESAPHILGLHLVTQIVRAHGGQAAFGCGSPGAVATLTFDIPQQKCV